MSIPCRILSITKKTSTTKTVCRVSNTKACLALSASKSDLLVEEREKQQEKDYWLITAQVKNFSKELMITTCWKRSSASGFLSSPTGSASSSWWPSTSGPGSTARRWAPRRPDPGCSIQKLNKDRWNKKNVFGQNWQNLSCLVLVNAWNDSTLNLKTSQIASFVIHEH